MIKKLFLLEKYVLAAIVINALVILLVSFPTLCKSPLLNSLDHLFILYFVVEAALKIHTYGYRLYFANHWNKFDFLIVLFSLPSFVAVVCQIPDTSFLLMLRLFRLVRLVRFFNFVPNLKQLILGLRRAFKASLFVLIALVGYNLILCIFTCNLFGQAAPQFFGNPLTSFYTIFQMFTLEGWNDIPPVVIKNSPEWQSGFIKLYFAFVVLSGGIFGLSIANAVFVDEMTIDNNKVLEEKIDDLTLRIEKITNLLEDKR